MKARFEDCVAYIADIGVSQVKRRHVGHVENCLSVLRQIVGDINETYTDDAAYCRQMVAIVDRQIRRILDAKVREGLS